MKGKSFWISSILVGSACLGLVSCASIVCGTKAEVVLNGNVDEPIDVQTDYKMYERQYLPAVVKVKRGKETSKITLTSENYDYQDILVPKKTNGWVWGNLAFGGIVGAIVDCADGAAWKPAEESYYVNAIRKSESLFDENAPQYSNIVLEQGNVTDEEVELSDYDVDDDSSASLHDSNTHLFSTFLENYIVEWERKGEFETTAQWKQRISEENINKKLSELSALAKEKFIELESEALMSSIRLGKYDADNEVFSVHSDVKTIYVDVPLDVAPLFKEKWEEVEKRFEYDVVNDRLTIRSAIFKLDGKEYRTVKVIKEQSYHEKPKTVREYSQQQVLVATEPTDGIEYQNVDARSEQTSPFAEAIGTRPKRANLFTGVVAVQDVTSNSTRASMYANGSFGLHSVKYIDERRVRLDINRLYYLNSENPDNLKYVDATFRECLLKNGIRITDDMDKADAIITGHAVNVEGGILYYLTVMDASGELLWQSEPQASKKTKFKKSVKSVVKKSCKDLAYAFNVNVDLPVSSPRHYMHRRINPLEFTTPEYAAALRLYEAEDYKAAVKSFDRVIESHPYFADAYFFRSIANCKKRDINEGKRDMMYFHKLRPHDERFDEGIKYVYYELALRAERRARNAEMAARIMNQINNGVQDIAGVVNGSKVPNRTVPTISTSSYTRSNSATTQKQICSICHGTGKSPSPSTVAQYGQVKYQYCDICKKTGTPHYHKVCFKCHGKGYVNY